MKDFEGFRHNIMEHIEKQMNENSNQQDDIREYLLGNLNDEVKMRQIEEKLLLDDDFNEQLSIAEDELTDEYLNDTLTKPERERFLQFFLISPERKEKLRLISNLREYAVSRASSREVKKFPSKKTGWFDWRGLFSSPVWRFAAIALLVFGLGFGVWRTAFYQSDVERGKAQLRLAYRGQRPLESRTTVDFGYAPHVVIRGETKVTDKNARDSAERFLFYAKQDNTSDAEVHHAWGLLFLTEKEFDKALEEFKVALKLAPDNAKLHSDMGAAYLEKADLIKDEKGEESLESAESSLQHLNRALELDGNLLEALFNKALLLHKTGSLNQALEAWKNYLEKDSTSSWAAEAQAKIKEIESQKSQNLSADELQAAFLAAFHQKNEVEASQLISQNREIIREKYLPQKLAISLVESAGDKRNEYLQALIYAGELEKAYIGDSFAADLGAFYINASETNLELLKRAHDLTRDGYQLCLAGHKVNDALEKFKLARELFLQAGNIWEAKLSEFLIVYCLKNTGKIIKSLPMAEEIIGFCEQKNYKWLYATILVWYAGGQRAIGQRAAAKISYQNSLNLAEEIKDSFMIQSTLLELAKQSNFVGQNRTALRYLQGAFKNGAMPGASLRQRWRNFSDGAELLAKVKYYNLAKVISLENIRLAEDLVADSKDSLLLIYSQLDAGIAFARAGDEDEAKKWLLLAKRNAQSIDNETDRKEILVKISLELGHLETKIRNYSRAAEFYQEAFGYVETDQTPYYVYEIQKSRLLNQMSLGNDAEVEKQIVEILEMAKNYREQISEEQERNSFFDNEQTIYDIAIANDYRLGKREQAYNYLETSNSRSLLDWLKKGVEIKEDKKKIEFTFKDHVEPLRLDEIRVRMPDRVQILQYTVLENQVLIWLISKDNFTVVPSLIDYEKLNEKVKAYARLISEPDAQKQDEAKILARELYDLLISPISNQLEPNREICLIPHKILFHLPFAALTAPDEKPFLAQFNFFYAPSANAFLLFTDNARQKSALTNESLLSVGNPQFDKHEYKALKNLPDAEGEVEDISLFYHPGAQKLIGPQATKTALQNSLKNVEVIHFAGHYIVKHGEPLASGLLLTKTGNGDNPEADILTNAELIRQTLPQVKLVVLPACQTGVEQYYNGEGLVGLSRTFLAAGAPLVVASQWQVDSGATAQLMKRFHFFRKREKLSTTEALRSAQLEMLEDGRYRQPYFWAAFATYGGYAEY